MGVSVGPDGHLSASLPKRKKPAGLEKREGTIGRKKKDIALKLVYKTDIAEQSIPPGRALPVTGHL